MTRRAKVSLATLLILARLSSGCSFPSPAATPEAGPATLAAHTAEVLLTAAPGGTPSALPQQPSLTQASASPDRMWTPSTTLTADCIARAELLGNVTVRDNTSIPAGQRFVKIWRLQNSGTCAWTPDYALAFFGGDRMDAAPLVPLGTTTLPGGVIELAVDMVAPNAPGTYQGFWRLRNPQGALFGIGPNGDQSFWVKIVVLEALTPTVTPIPTTTATAAPVVLASGMIDLSPGSAADLDGGAAGPAAGADLLFSEASLGERLLTPQNGARLALYTPSPAAPRPADCLAMPLDATPVPTSSLSAGSRVCYLTDTGHPGYLSITGLDGTLTAEYLTWLP